MRMRTAHLCAALLAAGACATEGPTGDGAALDPITCPDGEVAYNFSRFPNPSGSSETASQAGATSSTVPVYVPPPRNTIQIKKGTCGADADWTSLFKESCEGQLECAFSRTDCFGSVTMTYACSDTPSDEHRLVCNGAKLSSCVFQVSCPQPTPPATSVPPRQACVPRKCNVSQVRDADMRCVPNLNRPLEYTWGFDEEAWKSERMGVYLPASGIHAVYPSVRRTWDAGDGAYRLDLERSTLPQFVRGDAINNQRFAWLTESALPLNHILLADTLYDVQAAFFYVVPPGAPNDGPKGTLALWVYDGYGTGTTTTDYAFRCLMHSVDLSKYGPGKKVDGTRFTYKIDLNERFVVPRDCRENSAMFFQSQRIVSAAKGLTPVDFANSYKQLQSKLTASYDMENRTILLDAFTDDAKKLDCSVNPVNFYFNEQADAHDRYAWYKQREIPLNFDASDPYWSSDAVKARVGGNNVFVQEATQTTVGLSSVRPKAIEYRIGTVGPPHGYLRMDADWYLAGDRHGFWAAQGLVEQGVTLEAFLVPLASDGSELLAVNALSLGTQRLFKSTAYGETISAKYRVTEALRQKLMEPGSAFEASKDGRKFKLKMCVKLADGNTDTLETSQYSLAINAADKCRTAAAPIVVKLDRAVTPLEPPTSDVFADSQPGDTGDGRVSQQSDNDTSSECADPVDANGKPIAGPTACQTDFANASEGQGTFGRSMVSMHNTATAEGASKAVVEKDVELLGFEVLNDDEEEPFQGPGAKVSFNVEPDWDRIAELLKTTIPGPRYEGKHVAAGVKGLSIGFEYKAPVRYGLLQGEIIFGISVGAGAGVVIEYTKLADTQVNCGNDNNCELLYVKQTAKDLRSAATECYQRGGRLAELSSTDEATRFFGKVGANERYWVGGQVANEYAPAACLQTWAQPCVAGHRTSMRWLSDSQDFATNTGFGAFSLSSTDVFGGGKNVTAEGIASGKPVDKGVTVDSSGVLRAEDLTSSYPSLCKLVNTASSDSHELKGTVEIAAAAGVSLGFCSPSAEAKVGVCIEGSLNFIEAVLSPNLTYTHHNLKDAAGRRGQQTDLTFQIDFEINVLSGSIDLKIVFFKWFNFKFNLMSFKGLHIPFDSFAKKEWPLKEDFK